MENEVLVKVEGLSKKFCKDLKTSLWYGVKDIFGNIGSNKKENILRPKEFWAVRDISFELRRGECLGLIGHNGAGKSTLLKMLNGLINPDEGKITMKGRVGALIELGAGFNPILTGRENIYNNGAVLGFTKKEIDAKVEEIIDFSEIREFIDMPVQNYSSGMKVRLGFAVAAQMEPDVLIIDEVLAVGDVSFRAKCYERLGELMKTSAVIIVSHSMPQVARITSCVLLLKSGMEIYSGEVNVGIEQYYDAMYQNKSIKINDNSNIEALELLPSKKNYSSSENFDFKLHFNSNFDFKDIEINVVILSREEIPVAQLNSSYSDSLFEIKKGYNEFTISGDGLNLNHGLYYISLTLFDVKSRSNLIWLDKICTINLKSRFVGSCSYLIKANFSKN
jgi:lipopolysaccharide transport system ATP-binding protein